MTEILSKKTCPENRYSEQEIKQNGWDGARLVEYLPSMQGPWAQSPALHKANTVTHACSPCF